MVNRRVVQNLCNLQSTEAESIKHAHTLTHIYALQLGVYYSSPGEEYMRNYNTQRVRIVLRARMNNEAIGRI